MDINVLSPQLRIAASVPYRARRGLSVALGHAITIKRALQSRHFAVVEIAKHLGCS